jgi:hypothetical protein
VGGQPSARHRERNLELLRKVLLIVYLPLSQLFRFGHVEAVKLLPQKGEGCAAFVDFEDAISASKAIESAVEFEGRTLRMDFNLRKRTFSAPNSSNQNTRYKSTSRVELISISF